MALYTFTDYAIALFILFVVLSLLSKFLFTRIAIDERFAIAISPIVVLAIVIRLLVDSGVYPKTKLWSVTPGVYLLGFATGAVIMVLSILIEKKTGWAYWKTALVMGSALLPYFLAKLLPHVAHPLRALYPLAIALTLTVLVYYIARGNESVGMLAYRSNIAIIFAHLLDASGTFVGMDFHRFYEGFPQFYEEHPLPEFLINLTGTAAIMIPLKLAVVGAALYYLETRKGSESDLYFGMIKVVFFILGIGPGTRNAMILTLG